MRSQTLIMIGMAATCGILAVSAGRIWLDRQSNDRLRQMQADIKPVTTKTIVVAALPVRYGMILSKQHFKEIPWPDTVARPVGSFETTEELLKDNVKRVALTAIDENEMVLTGKITGPGQKATLSTLIGNDMMAVTIRVSDIAGVAGFVLPGDHVDVMYTRQTDKESHTDVLLQNTRVLAIDQVADDKLDKPVVVRAVTIEVPQVSAQRVALAGTVGTLSLVLRKAGETAIMATQRLNIDDLGNPAPIVAAPTPVAENKPEIVTATLTPKSTTATVGVIRGMERKDYNVPVERGL